MMQKWMRLLVCAMFLVSGMGMVSAGTPDSLPEKLAMLEQDTYGAEQPGAIMDRLSRLEKDYNGRHNAGSMMVRVDALYDEVYVNEKSPSKQAMLNAIEWSLRNAVSRKPVQQRIDDLEMEISGKNSEGSFSARIDELAGLSFGADVPPMVQVHVPADTLVKVALSEAVSSRNIKVGDTVRCRVAEDVMVDGALVFLKGAEGEGVVTKVKQAKSFGRSAEIHVDFKKARTVDGSYVDTLVGEAAKSEMKRLSMAAGASLAGMALVGPIGIVTGIFVKGKDVELPEGTEVFIQTGRDEILYGIRTEMAAQ